MEKKIKLGFVQDVVQEYFLQNTKIGYTAGNAIIQNLLNNH